MEDHSGLPQTLSEALREFAKGHPVRYLDSSTHSADCWQWHPQCAMLFAADRLEDLNDQVEGLFNQRPGRWRQHETPTTLGSPWDQHESV